MSLTRVTYVSRYTGGGDLLAELASILAVSQPNNARAGVTGALLVGPDGFAQVLEGPPEAVDAVFERIQCDPRHDRIAVLAAERIAARDFAGWSMAGCDGREALREAGLQLVTSLPGGAGTPVVTLLRRAMRLQSDMAALLPT